MTNRLVLSAAAGVLAAGVVSAMVPARGPATVLTAAQLAHTAAELAPGAGASGTALAALAHGDGYEIELEDRTRDGAAEMHQHADDVMLVTAGKATLVSGGEMVTARATAAGEWRGSAIRGGERREVGAGDLIRVAAGTPHQFLVAPGAAFAVIAIKVAAAARGR